MASLAGARSGTYVVVQHASGEVVKGIADMSIFDSYSGVQLLSHASHIRSASVVVADMNLNVRVLCELANVLGSSSSFGAHPCRRPVVHPK